MGCELGHDHLIRDKDRVLIALLINLAVMSLEIWGGIKSGSISLFSDGMHMTSHLIVLVFAYFAETDIRYEPRAVFINAIFLICLSVYMFCCGVWKFIFPSEILYGTMFIVATIGLTADLCQVWLFYPAKDHHSRNMKSIFSHVLSDAGLSLAIIIGSVCIYLWGFYRVDAVILFLFSPLVFFWGMRLLR